MRLWSGNKVKHIIDGSDNQAERDALSDATNGYESCALHLPNDVKFSKKPIVKHISTDEGEFEEATEAYYYCEKYKIFKVVDKWKTKSKNGKVKKHKNVAYLSIYTSDDGDTIMKNCTDSTDLTTSTMYYDDEGTQRIKDHELRHRQYEKYINYIYAKSVQYIKLKEDNYRAYRKGDKYMVMMDGVAKEFNSKEDLKKWLDVSVDLIEMSFMKDGTYRDTPETKELKLFQAGQDYIRKLLGVSTMELFQVMNEPQRFNKPTFGAVDTQMSDHYNQKTKEANAFVRERYKDLQQDYKETTTANNRATKRIWSNMVKPALINGIVGRTVTTGAMGEMLYDEWAKVIYKTEYIFFKKDDCNYNKDVIADFKKLQPKIDDFITLASGIYFHGSKMQYLLITGASNAGKTLIARLMGGIVPSSVRQFKAIAKGRVIAKEEFTKYQGIVIMDDVGKTSMPDVESYKTFHDADRGIVFGNDHTKFTQQVKLTILTKTDGADIFSNANVEYANRTTHFMMEDTPLETSAMFHQMGYDKYTAELGRYFRCKMQDVSQNPNFEEKHKIEQEHKLDVSGTDFAALVEDIVEKPSDYFTSVTRDDIGLYITGTKTQLMQQIANKVHNLDIDISAIFKELNDKHLDYKTKKIDGRPKRVYRVK